MAIKVLLLADSEVQSCVEPLLHVWGTRFQIDHRPRCKPSGHIDADVVLSEISMDGSSLFEAIASLAEVAARRPRGHCK